MDYFKGKTYFIRGCLWQWEKYGQNGKWKKFSKRYKMD